MKRPRLKTLLLIPVGLFAAFYLFGVFINLTDQREVAPLGAAVRAQQIGEAMLEVTVRGDEFENGDKLATRKILRYSKAYRQRIGAHLRASPGTREPPLSNESASETLDGLIQRCVEAQRDDDGCAELRAELRDVAAESFVQEIEANRALLEAVRAVVGMYTVRLVRESLYSGSTTMNP